MQYTKNRLMDESFEACERYGTDIYALGLESLQMAMA